jgi:uncharacterized membrane protein YbhN (UPF0104 family)
MGVTEFKIESSLINLLKVVTCRFVEDDLNAAKKSLKGIAKFMHRIMFFYTCFIAPLVMLYDQISDLIYAFGT